MALDTNIINVALPVITSEFEDLKDYAWYGSAYLLTLTAFQPLFGSFYRYYQTDIVYRLTIFIFESEYTSGSLGFQSSVLHQRLSTSPGVHTMLIIPFQ